MSLCVEKFSLEPILRKTANWRDALKGNSCCPLPCGGPDATCAAYSSFLDSVSNRPNHGSMLGFMVVLRRLAIC